MTLIEIPDDQAAAWKARAEAEGLTLEAWLAKLAKSRKSRRGAAKQPPTHLRSHSRANGFRASRKPGMACLKMARASTTITFTGFRNGSRDGFRGYLLLDCPDGFLRRRP